jgi:hypothetical protein
MALSTSMVLAVSLARLPCRRLPPFYSCCFKNV